VRQAKEAMNIEVIKELVEDKILAKPLMVRGNVLSDEYGLMMIVTEANAMKVDIKEEATIMLTDLEGFQ
jgi:hypothetical protein